MYPHAGDNLLFPQKVGNDFAFAEDSARNCPGFVVSMNDAVEEYATAPVAGNTFHRRGITTRAISFSVRSFRNGLSDAGLNLSCSNFCLDFDF